MLAYFMQKKEFDRPRLIIDNNCTMPSRVRAFLYRENVEILVNQMIQSIEGLINIGCTKIILACNSSHLFLPDIYAKRPYLKNYIINIIDSCVQNILDDRVKNVFLLGTEATIDSQIYQNKLDELNIECSFPKQSVFPILRNCIEAVKQNSYSSEVRNQFLSIVNSNNNCILGCTELPILLNKYRRYIRSDIKFYDPITIVINNLKNEFDEYQNFVNFNN